jgi:predicted esterase
MRPQADALDRRLIGRMGSGRLWCDLAVLLAVVFLLASGGSARGAILVLKNGIEVQGDFAPVASLGSDVLTASGPGEVDTKLIYVVDDGLRRVFVSRYQCADIRDEVETAERIQLRQPVARSGTRIASVGALVKAPTPFDPWGRRVVSMMSRDGPIDVLQGITEVTPRFARVQSLQQQGKSYVWDMRVATSSIPRDILSTVLKQHLNDDNPDERLSIVRLYLQSQRYRDAEGELRDIIDDFPGLQDLDAQLTEIHQLYARQQLQELKLRQAAGQHELVARLLQQFPDEGVAGEIRLEVRELLAGYEQAIASCQALVESLEERISKQPAGPRRDVLESFHKELARDLNMTTLSRLADYNRLAADDSLGDEQKLALALSGWLVETGGTDNLAVAVSMREVRDLLRQYLVATSAADRMTILEVLKSHEAGTPAHVARLLAAMKPPFDAIPEEQQAIAGVEAKEGVEGPGAAAPEGMLRFVTPGLAEGEQLEYWVQLPPEYDPYRRYPTVVTLHGAGSDPQLQIDWWAGPHDAASGTRLGQATRYGYIVIAPRWAAAGQKQYDYSPREHAAVLYCLRDALQRLAIDLDRVFLSGHSMGGDAAWDIGLAHPDLWAGVIPIVASAGRAEENAPGYVHQYWVNAGMVPLLFVGGEMDPGRLQLNARDWNRYLTRSGFDTMIVEYLGRGHEHFQDEIQHIFQWMGYHQRNFFPTEFQVVTMRRWDNFFWWVEVDGIPDGSLVHPAQWPPQRSRRPMTIQGRIVDKQQVLVNTGSERARIWLSPELVTLDQPVTISVNGRTKARGVTPSLEVMLEDARTRGDRTHPFWCRVDVATGRVQR